MEGNSERDRQDERDLASLEGERILATNLSEIDDGLSDLTRTQRAFRSSGNQAFDDITQWELDTHWDKSHDYANEKEPLANFFLQAQITGMSVDMVFLNAIAIKIARLKELISADKVAKNESIEDTLGDLSVYAKLWRTYRQRTASDF